MNVKKVPFRISKSNDLFPSHDKNAVRVCVGRVGIHREILIAEAMPAVAESKNKGIKPYWPKIKKTANSS